MVHAQYVKDFDVQQIRLYFDGVPPKVVLTQLKGNGWHWNPHELYWGASLTKHNEDFAKKLGATDGTTPNSNPATAADTMDCRVFAVQ